MVINGFRRCHLRSSSKEMLLFHKMESSRNWHWQVVLYSFSGCLFLINQNYNLVEGEIPSHPCRVWDAVQQTCISAVGPCHGLIFDILREKSLLKILFQVSLCWNRCNYMCSSNHELILVLLELKLRHCECQVAAYFCLFNSCMSPLSRSIFLLSSDTSEYELWKVKHQ